MPTPLISIIIPVYNVEAYVGKCLDSVLSQTYKNLEVLVIDDGSTDNSRKIVKEYEKRDSRIRLFSQKNYGVSSALNVGLENFTGDWLGFVDSDDWIEPNMFEVLLNNIDGVDIVICSYYRDTALQSEVIQNKTEIKEQIISSENMLIYPLIRDYYMGFCGYVWNKMFSAEVVKNSRIYFDEKISYAEDVLFYEVLVSKQKCTGVYVDIPLYHYLKRDGAITQSESYEIKTDVLIVYKKVEELLPNIHKYWARGFYCYHASVIAELAIKKGDREMLKIMQKEIDVHYDDYVRTNEAFPEKIMRIDDLLLQTL
ncbi:MAG: glycosyltransferase [Lachnospiraceae bacterium]|jgi:glycosyltransferase involved in cell wall biosynthesis|nr:glycosyltransferase [Lachnospiraceae bacterium]